MGAEGSGTAEAWSDAEQGPLFSLEKRGLQGNINASLQCLRALQESWKGTFCKSMEW